MPNQTTLIEQVNPEQVSASTYISQLAAGVLNSSVKNFYAQSSSVFPDYPQAMTDVGATVAPALRMLRGDNGKTNIILSAVDSAKIPRVIYGLFDPTTNPATLTWSLLSVPNSTNYGMRVEFLSTNSLGELFFGNGTHRYRIQGTQI